jgi:hypothetical protein
LSRWLASWATRVLAEGVPECAEAWWSASTLLAFEKPGGRGVRPIAVGEVLPRLLSTLLLQHYMPRLTQQLVGVGQLGVGVSCGAEALGHGVAAVLHSHSDWAVLDLDILNAFNMLDRPRLFATLVAEGYGGLVPFLASQYASPGRLLWAGGTCSAQLLSCRGVRQGDPLGPALFALALLPVDRDIGVRHPETPLLMYVDDGGLL